MRSFADSAVFCKSAAPMSRWQRLAVARVLRAASTAAPRQIERRRASNIGFAVPQS